MNYWKRIKQLGIKQLVKLSLLFLSRPLLIGPTIRATKQTMKICDALYGAAHHQPNKANAFRHALWNILIGQKSLYFTKNQSKSIYWAQKVTVLYEKVTNNSQMDEAMDLHNNRLGQEWFLEVFDEKKEKIIDFLHEKLKNARKVTKIEDIDTHPTELIYLTEL